MVLSVTHRVCFLECKIVEKGVSRDVFRGCIVVSKREFV